MVLPAGWVLAVLLTDDEIFEARAMAQAEMFDTCRIVRFPAAAAGGAMDPTTFQYPATFTNDIPDNATVVYEGPCRIQIRADINANIVEPQELEREWAYQTSTLHLPVDTDDRIVSGASKDVQSDDVCVYLTSTYDPGLPDRVFNMQATTHKTLATVRRFRIREATG